jgi:hypothetical protein
MYLKEFKKGEVLVNTLKAHPKTEFVFGNGRILLNTISSSNPDVPDGNVSLYGMSVDRLAIYGGDDAPYYAFISKDGAKNSFTITNTDDYVSSAFGEEFTSSYPLTSTIHQELGTDTTHLKALRVAVDYYRYYSKYFDYAAYIEGVETNLLSIPSIFYSSHIKKGSVKLDLVFTGSLVGRAQDKDEDGILYQTTGNITGEPVGLVLYNEGFIILTGSTTIQPGAYDAYSRGAGNASWLNFGDISSNVSASIWRLAFSGTTNTPVMTMFAIADVNEFNYSTNPTFIDIDDNKVSNTGSTSYSEYRNKTIKNVVKSSYTNHSASFKKTTYISQIGLFDQNRNLIGIAKLATPVRKEEKDSYIFKLAIDL